jgi:endogenous inhibitor of DNA gyrase (YacG/DUF329 family)
MTSVTGERRCVHCRRRPVADAWRPFCSERCRLLDLRNWMDGSYRVPGDATSVPDAAAADDGAGDEDR